MEICKMIMGIGKNRRGDLRDNVPEIIIAVLGILLIVFVAYQIYHVFVNSENENAKKVLNNLEAKINAIPEGQNGTFMLQGFKEANEWFLAGWNKADKPDDKPSKCFDSSCICICKKPGATRGFSNSESVKLCNEKGFCRKFSIEKITVKQDIPATFVPSSGPGGGGGVVPARTEPYIFMTRNVIELGVKKDKNSITVTQTST
jgi:hypothetical protein